MTHEQASLWEVHLRIPAQGPVSISCKHGGESLTHGVARTSTPTQALRLIEGVLSGFGEGEQLFITARTHDSHMSMWRTNSKATGLYWCAAALAKLWRASKRKDPPSGATALDSPDPSSAPPVTRLAHRFS